MEEPIDPGDRAAVEELLYAYADHLDRGEITSLGQLFTEEVRVDYGPHMSPLRSRSELESALQRGQNELFSATSHHLSNVRLRRGERARAVKGVAYVYAWHRYRDGAPDGELWGRYEIEAQQTCDGWRLSALRLACAGTRDLHSDRMHPIR